MKPHYSKESILSNLNIKELNEMQEAAIEQSAVYNDIILLSNTGSGKTLAFLFPILDLLEKNIKATQAMIIVPSRELALQIEQVFRKMGTGFKITCCYGGHKREIEENNLIEPPALIVGTPGRIADHIRRGNITNDSIQMLVLDEFDKSLELGFSDELSEIISALPNIQKRMLTSATKAEEIPEFVGLDNPKTIDFLKIDEDQTEALEIQTVLSPDKDKLDTLFNLLCYIGNRSSIIFCNHKESVSRVSSLLKEKGIPSAFYHGSLEQYEREAALCKFRNGTVNFLITTDIAARGLDIPFIRYIIHYHLPNNEATFTHRNGRTARQEASGTAILIHTEEEKIPDYLSDAKVLELPESSELEVPDRTKWTTVYIPLGKKNKVNKIDFVGFFTNRASLKSEDIGLIEVKDFGSYVAIRKSKVNGVLQMVKDHKIKNKKVKMDIVK